MIYVNDSPILTSRDFESNIYFTSNTVCPRTTVYMKYEDAPDAGTLTTLRVRNRDYKKLNEDDPSGPNNEDPEHPFYLFDFLMYVDGVQLFNDLRVQATDEEGELLFDENENPVLLPQSNKKRIFIFLNIYSNKMLLIFFGVIAQARFSSTCNLKIERVFLP
jgi:hypothetical protein